MQSDEPLPSATQLLAELDYPQQPSYLLAAMQDFHRIFGSFDAQSESLLKTHFHADAALWQSLVTLFPEKISAKHTLQVCRGAVCGERLDVSGLDISDVAIVECCCMGLCQNSPVARLDDTVITDATIDSVTRVISQLEH